jgi:polyamine oxidase
MLVNDRSDYIYVCDQVVNHIKYSSSGVTITTEDNSTYTADYAIVSVSLGVLKSNLIDYEPDLPVSKY